jgi:hypothetical protein
MIILLCGFFMFFDNCHRRENTNPFNINAFLKFPLNNEKHKTKCS